MDPEIVGAVGPPPWLSFAHAVTSEFSIWSAQPPAGALHEQ